MPPSVRVINPVDLPAELPCERHVLRPGARMGYKPNAVELSTGELVLANFHTHYEAYDDGSMCEHIVLHRSGDGGRVWTARHVDHLWGREPYLNPLAGDVLLITTHFLDADVRNRTGHTTVYLHRSEDRGETWTSALVDVDQIPEDVAYTYTSRNILDLGDGTCIMGVGCGHGADYLFRSGDGGLTWQVEKMATTGFDALRYEYSILQEGVFHLTEEGRLLLLARCDARAMGFDHPLPGLPDLSAAGGSSSDHWDVEIIFESGDDGHSWTAVQALPILGCMYPSLCSLGRGCYLFTYTQRVPLADRHMGVYGLVLQEREDGTFGADVTRDVIVIDEKTPDHYDSGGGFGNTLRLRDGALLTPYSYLEADPEIDELLRTGSFMDEAVFNRYRDRALPYYRRWVEGVTWERLVEADRVTQQHCFMGCTQVLNLSGPITEVCRWNLPG